jgi:hypothetical protein
MKEDIQEELRDISPFLAGLERKDPFKAPKYYFDTLADKVLEQAQPQVVTTPPQYLTRPNLFIRLGHAISHLLRPPVAIAMASITLILAVGGWFMYQSNNTKQQLAQTEVSSEDIHQYIQEHIADFDDELLLNDEKLAFDTEGGALHKTDMNDADIEEYLINNIGEKDLEALDN